MRRSRKSGILCKLRQGDTGVNRKLEKPTDSDASLPLTAPSGEVGFNRWLNYVRVLDGLGMPAE